MCLRAFRFNSGFLRTTYVALAWRAVFGNIFFSVVVGDLFSRFDTTRRENEHALFMDHWFRIRLARMIDVSGFVYSWFTVDRFISVHGKQIFAATGDLFPFGNLSTDVFDDACIPRNRLTRE